MKRGFIKCYDTLLKERWHELYIFFKDFRPTHIEFRHWENDIWYFYGVSELFDELKEGDQIPQYDVIFTRTDDKVVSYKFERINHYTI